MPHSSVGSESASSTGGHGGSQDDFFATLELRWFARGPLPTAALGWFEYAVPHVEVEERIDSYLLTGRPDLGVKRRNGGPLEVKDRMRIGTQVSVAGRLVARVEEWHKTIRPAIPEAEGPWIDVKKTVRNYPLRVTTADGLVAACDVELAAVEVEGIEAWTFALEASGPTSERMGLLHSAAELFVAEGEAPARIADALDLEAGYPAWLTTVTGT